MKRKTGLAPRLTNRLIPWPHGAAWTMVFVLGFCFWIPALLKARLGASAVTEDSAARANSSAAPIADIAIAPGAESAVPVRAPKSPIVVAATVLGRTRRAAVVNGRLYREGDKIASGSELYRLASVAEDHIELVSLGPCGGVKSRVMLSIQAASVRDSSGSH